MRPIFVLLLLCAACDRSSRRVVAEGDLPPRALAQTSLSSAQSAPGHVFQCLQDDAGRVRLTGILRQRLRSSAAPESQGRIDTLVVLETPVRTGDCKNRAGGQPPPALEPRSLVVLRGAGAAIQSFLGDTVIVFGEAPSRGAMLDAEPLSMRLDSLRVISAGQRIRVGARGELLP